MRKQCREDHCLGLGEQAAVLTVFRNLEDNCDVSPVQREPLFDSLLNRVFLRGLEVLESPNP